LIASKIVNTQKREKKMVQRLLKSLSAGGRRQDGAVTVEMALLLPVFLMLVGGILDFGHAWYMKQVVTNACREGARYGITYKTNSNGIRIAPSALNPSIQTTVTQYLSSLLPSGSNPTVTCNGTGYSSANPSGLPLNVTVSAVKNWWLIDGLIPSLGSSKTITITTTMLVE
jgi:Flp pilus assembly protein TadG